MAPSSTSMGGTKNVNCAGQRMGKGQSTGGPAREISVIMALKALCVLEDKLPFAENDLDKKEKYKRIVTVKDKRR